MAHGGTSPPTWVDHNRRESFEAGKGRRWYEPGLCRAAVMSNPSLPSGSPPPRPSSFASPPRVSPLRLRAVAQLVLAAAVARAAAGCGGGISPVGDTNGNPATGNGPTLGGPTTGPGGGDDPDTKPDASFPDARPDVVVIDAQADRSMPECITGQVDPDPSFCCQDGDPGCTGGGSGGDTSLCQLDCRQVCKKYAPTSSGWDGWCNYSASATETKVFYYCGACGVGRLPDGTMTCGRGDTIGERLAMQSYYEAASVVAFRRLADVLAREGAPADLVRRARRAADEERRHAHLFAELARARGAEPAAPSIGPNETSLFALALENAREGLVRETYGAVVAMHQGEHAVDPELRRAFAAIASDEISHAELSWDLARWFDTRLSESQRMAVEAARLEALATLGDAANAEHDALDAALGLPEPAAGRAIFGHLFREIDRAAA